jgi:regulatory protein
VSPPECRPVKGKGLAGPGGPIPARTLLDDPDRDPAGGPRARRRRRQPGDPPTGTAKDRALGLLNYRWRSRSELDRRLRQAGFPADEIATALDDLEAAGLIDDERFAAEVVRTHATGRLSGDRAVRAKLAAGGVAPALRDRALLQAGDEGDRALALARKRAPRLAALASEAAYRRLYGALVRRGYGPGTARDACRVALHELTVDLPVGEQSEP